MSPSSPDAVRRPGWAGVRFVSPPPASAKGLVLRLHHDAGFAVAADVHAEVQAHLAQDVLDLLQGLAAEVAVLEHLRLALLDQIADGLDLGGAQAVARAHRELQLLDALV